MRSFMLSLVCSVFLFSAAACHAQDNVVYSQTQFGSASFANPDPIILTFTETDIAISDATLTLVATSGELSGGFNKRLENLSVEGVTYTTPGIPGLTPGYMLPTTQTQEFYTGSPTALPEPVVIPLAELNGFVADGQVVVSVDDPGFIASGDFNVTLSYTTNVAVPEPSGCAIVALAFLKAASRRRRSLIEVDR